MTRPMRVLLVEDNPADAMLSREILADSKLHIEISLAANGEEALDFLYGRGQFAGALKPDLILLDLNMPGKDGRAVLTEIKSTENFKRIPVVILTSSNAERDVIQSYHLGANCYVVKPVDFQAFQTIVQAVENFWFTIVELPPPANG